MKILVVDNYDSFTWNLVNILRKNKQHSFDVIFCDKIAKSILGICLGLQAIGIYFGGSLTNLEKVVHGRSKKIVITSSDEPLFSGIASPCTVGLYHSWSVSRKDFPDCLCITAESEGRIMALAHKTFDVRGTQFHPESIMTPFGEKMINNWLS
jgi:anthranilate synthase component 2